MIPSLYPPFKHWAETGSVYLISDPHFDDADCLYMDPNWIPSEEHIARINKIVHRTDTLICLGDCGNLSRFDEIKCPNRILIKGNHDDKGNSRYTPYFCEVYSGPLFISDKILLSHEPIYNECWYNFHGHRHSDNESNYRGINYFNCCSNVVNYMPINLGEMIKSGILSQIPTIHRLTIDNAIEKQNPA